MILASVHFKKGESKTNLVAQERARYIRQMKRSGRAFGHQLLEKTQMKSQHMKKTYVALDLLPS